MVTVTRRVELFHTRDATANSTANRLLHHFYCLNIPPHLQNSYRLDVVADNIEEFLALIRVQHRLHLAHSKGTNERMKLYSALMQKSIDISVLI